MKEPDALTRALEVIASPTSRKLIELIAAAPRTMADIRKELDLADHQVTNACDILVEAGLAEIVKLDRKGRTHENELVQFDGGVLRKLFEWLERVRMIRGGSL